MKDYYLVLYNLYLNARCQGNVNDIIILIIEYLKYKIYVLAKYFKSELFVLAYI